MRLSVPSGLAALALSALWHFASHTMLDVPTGIGLAIAVVCCFLGMIRLTRANGDLPRADLVMLGLLMVGLMGFVATILLV